jgi:hypothetical protein
VKRSGVQRLAVLSAKNQVRFVEERADKQPFLKLCRSMRP